MGCDDHYSRFFENARPDPDLRYCSNSIARWSSWKQMYVSSFQGRYLAVWGEPPAL